MKFVRIGHRNGISSQRPLRSLVNGIDVVVFQVEEEFFAVENNCPHQHFTILHQGEIRDCTVTCPMHGWNFELRTGHATNGNGRLKTFAVDTRGDELWIEEPHEDESFPLFER